MAGGIVSQHCFPVGRLLSPKRRTPPHPHPRGSLRKARRGSMATSKVGGNTPICIQPQTALASPSLIMLLPPSVGLCSAREEAPSPPLGVPAPMCDYCCWCCCFYTRGSSIPTFSPTNTHSLTHLPSCIAPLPPPGGGRRKAMLTLQPHQHCHLFPAYPAYRVDRRVILCRRGVTHFCSFPRSSLGNRSLSSPSNPNASVLSSQGSPSLGDSNNLHPNP